ncbi:helicase [Synechococcus sp. M16CYN]|uniref:helicase n=1 Tax=Synechococcus sp. M16CYN TaxID=3103139 RepID=UPI003253BA7C
MLEAQAHQRLKTLLRQEGSTWPHHLTVSRLVGRSLRRRDTTLLQLPPSSGERWWLGVLVPLCLNPGATALVLTLAQRKRLLQLELPRLKQHGLRLPCWQGIAQSPGDQLWILDTNELVTVYQQDRLGDRQLLIPNVERLSQRLRHSLAIQINNSDWERLRQAHPELDQIILEFHERLSRQLFQESTRNDDCVRLQGGASQALRDLLRLVGPCPPPWSALLATDPVQWAEWAELDHRLLQWTWQLRPLEPLQFLNGLLNTRPILMLTESGKCSRIELELSQAQVTVGVTATLREQELKEPLPLYAPHRQPLPNTEIYAQHLLEQSRRLILGRTGLAIVLIDDQQLRRQLTSALAAEFGQRVVEESTTPESNGVISARWDWWLRHHDQLPAPEQLIVALLPLASLTSPLTASRVERLKRLGEDWFRTMLLPEALCILPAAIAPLRRAGGRLAILDGRLRGRPWGDQVLQQLEPWMPLKRLLPD